MQEFLCRKVNEINVLFKYLISKKSRVHLSTLSTPKHLVNIVAAWCLVNLLERRYSATCRIFDLEEDDSETWLPVLDCCPF